MNLPTRGRGVLEEISRTVGTARTLGVMHQHTDDPRLDGRTVTLHGERLLNFGSCSYLGLDLDPRLGAAATDAVQRYGTTFSSSRAYVSLGLYRALEEALGRIFGGAVLVTPTTTLGHLSALPVLIGGNDAVMIDSRAHQSLRMAAQLVARQGAAMVTVPHNNVERLERTVARLSTEHAAVWYLADGMYSMDGDLAPMGAVGGLLDRHSKLRVYIDDAHAVSWTGHHGRGHALETLGCHPRLVVAASLSKSFGAGGAVLVFGDADERERVLHTGHSLIFGGPVPPASLGAATASARIHESDEIHDRQDALRDRIVDVRERLLAHRLPVVSSDDTPITFVGVGSEAAVMELHRRLRAEGVFVNASAYPAVPAGRGGIRFTTTLHQRLDDIGLLARALARHLPEVLAKEGRTMDNVTECFARSALRRDSTVAA